MSPDRTGAGARAPACSATYRRSDHYIEGLITQAAAAAECLGRLSGLFLFRDQLRPVITPGLRHDPTMRSCWRAFKCGSRAAYESGSASVRRPDCAYGLGVGYVGVPESADCFAKMTEGTYPTQKNGMVRLPDAPGLGIKVNVAEFQKKCPYRAIRSRAQVKG